MGNIVTEIIEILKLNSDITSIRFLRFFIWASIRT